MIAKSGTYNYKAAQVIADCLEPLWSDNDYTIKKTQELPKLLQEQDPLFPNEEYVHMTWNLYSLMCPIKK